MVIYQILPIFETMENKLNIDDILASLQTLNAYDRSRLQSALFDLQSDLELSAALKENLDDIKSGRVSSHDSVMKEIKEKYSS
jgi:predicted transcriptional regulator